MPRNKKENTSLSQREQSIMTIIWAKGTASVYGVWEELAKLSDAKGEKAVARMTVQVQLNRLVDKGWLLREKYEGRFHYRSIKDEAESKASVAGGLVDRMFHSSLSNFILCLKGDSRLNTEEIKKAKKLLEEFESETNKK